MSCTKLRSLQGSDSYGQKSGSSQTGVLKREKETEREKEREIDRERENKGKQRGVYSGVWPVCWGNLMAWC
jgi:hypothetical protein